MSLSGISPLRYASVGRVVDLDDGLDQLLAVLDGAVLEVLRDLDDVPLRTQLFVAPDQRVHLDEVDDALEIVLGADRQLHDRGLDAEALMERVDAEIEVGADLIHLVDEDQTRNVVLVGLAPDGFGLGLDALVAVEQRDGAVEHAERTLDFDGEVDVAGRVDDVEAVHAHRHGSSRTWWSRRT